jgi:hypothetical protein
MDFSASTGRRYPTVTEAPVTGANFPAGAVSDSPVVVQLFGLLGEQDLTCRDQVDGPPAGE